MSRYEPGDALAVSTPQGIGLFAAGTAVEVAERLWEALGDEAPLARVLAVIVEVYGISTLPDFAVAVVDPSDSSARLVVRGAFDAHVVTASQGGDEHISADAPSFWTERRIAAVVAVELRAAAVVSAPGSTLPLVSGVVGAVRVVTGPMPERTYATPGEVSAPAGGSLAGGTAEPVPPSPSTEDERSPGSAALPSIADAERPVERSGVPVPRDAPVGSADTPSSARPVVSSTHPPRADDTRTQSGQTLSSTTDDEPVGLSVEEGTTAYDDLVFGVTRMSSVEDAAIRASGDVAGPHGSAPAWIDAMPPGGGGVSAVLGDHDGLTVSAEQLAALREGGGFAPPPGDRSEPAPVSPAVMVSTTGVRTVLDRGAVVGVRPSAVRATGSVPHLVAVHSPSGEISRRHLEIRVEGVDVLAVDLDSTNGTRLLRLGADPVRLHPGAATLLVTGDRLDLGDGVVLSFEGLR